jgi:cytidine deaminase
MISMISDEQLVKLAMEMRERAYAPYSGFSVGAALLCEDGSVYRGCNVENSSYGATICAERAAAVSAVADGNLRFVKIAVAGTGDEYCVPCGICRQFLREFSSGLVFLCANSVGEFREYGFEDLLPNAFEL